VGQPWHHINRLEKAADSNARNGDIDEAVLGGLTAVAADGGLLAVASEKVANADDYGGSRMLAGASKVQMIFTYGQQRRAWSIR